MHRSRDACPVTIVCEDGWFARRLFEATPYRTVIWGDPEYTSVLFVSSGLFSDYDTNKTHEWTGAFDVGMGLLEIRCCTIPTQWPVMVVARHQARRIGLSNWLSD